MDLTLPANTSALALADNCAEECDISAENLAVAECVIRILDKGIDKLQIAFLIPKLLEDQQLLQRCLTKTEYQNCVKYYDAYAKHAKATEEFSQPPLHMSLIELIDLFCEKSDIKNIVPQHFLEFNKENQQLLNALEQLKQVIAVRLKTSAFAEMRKEKAIHRIYQDNEHCVTNFSKKRNLLHNQEINMRWKLVAKQALMQKYEEELATKKFENNIKIKREIIKSNHRLQEFQIKSKSKQEYLTNEVEKSQALYQKNLKTDLKIEKEVRDEKNKLLIQLQGLIKKYDQNIGDKIHENAELQKVYDEQRRKLDEFLVHFYVREAEYNELAYKKQYEITAAYERKLFFFFGTRAAKIIQRWWRKIMKANKKALLAEMASEKKKKNKK